MQLIAEMGFGRAQRAAQLAELQSQETYMAKREQVKGGLRRGGR